MFNKEKGNICPYLKKQCIGEDCMMWVGIRGYNHNTGKEVDEFGCSIAWMPVLLIDNTQKNRETGASVDSLRNTINTGVKSLYNKTPLQRLMKEI